MSEAEIPIFSSVSILEVAIKAGRGKDDFTLRTGSFRAGLLASRYEELPVHGTQAAAVQLLPLHHKDPFDRLMIAQAMVENIPFLTADRRMGLFPGDIRIV